MQPQSRANANKPRKTRACAGLMGTAWYNLHLSYARFLSGFLGLYPAFSGPEFRLSAHLHDEINRFLRQPVCTQGARFRR